MYAWEQSFAKLVATARLNEVLGIQRALFLNAFNLSVYLAAPRIILFACFMAYVLTGNLLTAKAVFITMALFNTLKTTSMTLFPYAIAQWAELTVSCSRIQTFLELGEMEPKTYNTIGFGDLAASPKTNAKPKSSLIMSILNELPVLEGSIQTVGTISYASQEAWSFNNSVRNNILLGSEYDEH
ncbi:unnamed protein product, partial [Oppiella nova]